MEKELKRQPETKIERKDMEAITDPYRQKEFATNQGVRFYFDKQIGSFEREFMRVMNDRFEDMEQSWTNMNEEMEQATRAIRDLQERLAFLEGRWYERIMRYIEWDILSIRIWLFEHGWLKKNPVPDEEPKSAEPGSSLELEVKVNALPVIDDLQGPPFGECGFCKEKKFLPEVQDFFPEEEGAPVIRKRVCSECKAHLQSIVDEINAGNRLGEMKLLSQSDVSALEDAGAQMAVFSDDVDPASQ